MPVAAAAASMLADQEAPPEVLTWNAAEPAVPARTDTCTDRTTVAETRSLAVPLPAMAAAGRMARARAAKRTLAFAVLEAFVAAISSAPRLLRCILALHESPLLQHGIRRLGDELGPEGLVEHGVGSSSFKGALDTRG